MASDRDDQTLHDALQQLRAADAQGAPSMSAIMGRRREPRRVMRPAPLIRLMAASVIVVVAIASYRAATHPEARLTVPREVEALSSWRAPTDAFLPPFPAIPRDTSILGPSVVDLP